MTAAVRLVCKEINEKNFDEVFRKISNEIFGIQSCKYLGKTNGILINYDRTRIDENQLITRLKNLGYTIELKSNQIVRTQLRIEGMHCNSCVSNICDAVSDLFGAIDIQLTFLDKLATITYDASVLHLNDIIDEIEKLSFQVAISTHPYSISDNKEELEIEIDNRFSNRTKFKQIPMQGEEKSELETCYFNVLGMTCASCVDNIQRNLSRIDGYLFFVCKFFVVEFFN